MKNKPGIYLLIVVTLICSCGVKGLYVHTICDLGPSCFAYEFCNNGTFRYKFFHETFGDGILQGTWKKSGDTIRLYVEKGKEEIFHRINTYYKQNQANKEIKVFLISEFGDTSFYNGPIKVNDGEVLNTDLFGILNLPNKPIYSITFKNEGSNQLIDTTFLLNDNRANYIEVYFVEKEKWKDVENNMTKVFIKKGLKLYPLSAMNNPDLMQKIFYRKIRWSCNNLNK